MRRRKGEEGEAPPPAKPADRTNRERQARFRANAKAAGLKRRDVWIWPGQEAELDDFAEKLRENRPEPKEPST